ncbi:MAG: malectin [Bacillota bacterium]|nr:malectin [Bacillota bacterium]
MKKWTKNNLFLIITIFIMILIQFLLLRFVGSKSYVGDEPYYIKFAENTIKNGIMYPTKSDIYSSYIFSPGYINYLVLLLRCFNNNYSVVLYFNIILNTMLMIEIYIISKNLFNKKTANIAIIIFCCLLSDIGIVMFTLSDLPFCVCAYGAVAVSLSNKKCGMAAAGVLLVLANWIRPFLIPFLIAILFIIFLKKYSYKKIIYFAVGLTLTIGIIGLSEYLSFGYFNYYSTTSGANLIMGANDDANGAFNPVVFNKGKIGHIPGSNWTFIQKNDYWTKSAVNWIKENPVKYVKLLPKKIIYTYATDTTFAYGLIGKSEANISISEIKNNFRNLISGNFSEIKSVSLIKDMIIIFNQSFYLLLLLFAVSGAFYMVKIKKYECLIFLSIIVLGSGMTVITVGNNRYHYPFIMSFIIIASFYIKSLFDMRLHKKPRTVSNLYKTESD